MNVGVGVVVDEAVLVRRAAAGRRVAMSGEVVLESVDADGAEVKPDTSMTTSRLLISGTAHPGAMSVIKVAPHCTALVSVRTDGTATERWLVPSADPQFADTTAAEWTADVSADDGGWRIDVGPYRLRARPTADAGTFGGTETGPEGESFFHVFVIARPPVEPAAFHRYRWLLVDPGRPPTIVELPSVTGGRAIGADVFGTRPFGVGRLHFANVTDGILRLEFDLVFDRQGEADAFQVRSTLESVVLQGPSYALYPIATAEH